MVSMKNTNEFFPIVPTLLTQRFSKTHYIVLTRIRVSREQLYVYRDISTILDFSAEYYRPIGKWTDENNIPLLRELGDGVIRTHGNVFLVTNGGRLLELIATCRRRSIS